MLERYAIINKAGNWLENIIVLDQSNANGWVPEEGTIMKKASEVDFASLPPTAQEQVKNLIEQLASA